MYHPPYIRLSIRCNACNTFQREAAEGESKNISEAKKRVAENESSANMAEASYRAEAHVSVSERGSVGVGVISYWDGVRAVHDSIFHTLGRPRSTLPHTYIPGRT